MYYQQFVELLDKCEELEDIQKSGRLIHQADIVIGKSGVMNECYV